jgi:NAD(P)-dependent dehydrogenase (short-subunit alcohol dehydrogenase family)
VRGLEGRVAIVTGGTGLIGGAVARRLISEGAVVAVTSRKLERSNAWVRAHEEPTSGRLFAAELDLSAPASIAGTVERISAALGPPTILVAAASLREALSADPDADLAGRFERLFGVDVAGHYLCAREMVEALAGSQPASVVFLSSIYAHAGVDPRIYPDGMAGTPPQYAAVKAGVDGLVRYLAAAWGSRGVRVNAVVGGGVENPARQSADFVSRYRAKTMLGRMARADELASAVAFLASDDASYITGSALFVDGGFTSW